MRIESISPRSLCRFAAALLLALSIGALEGSVRFATADDGQDESASCSPSDEYGILCYTRNGNSYEGKECSGTGGECMTCFYFYDFSCDSDELLLNDAAAFPPLER